MGRSGGEGEWLLECSPPPKKKKKKKKTHSGNCFFAPLKQVVLYCVPLNQIQDSIVASPIPKTISIPIFPVPQNCLFSSCFYRCHSSPEINTLPCFPVPQNPWEGLKRGSFGAVAVANLAGFHRNILPGSRALFDIMQLSMFAPMEWGGGEGGGSGLPQGIRLFWKMGI